MGRERRGGRPQLPINKFVESVGSDKAGTGENKCKSPAIMRLNCSPLIVNLQSLLLPAARRGGRGTGKEEGGEIIKEGR